MLFGEPACVSSTVMDYHMYAMMVLSLELQCRTFSVLFCSLGLESYKFSLRASFINLDVSISVIYFCFKLFLMFSLRLSSDL